MKRIHFAEAFQRRARLAALTAEDGAALSSIAMRYVATLKGGGTLFFAGNGGSAADAQHVATEYVVRYVGDRKAMAAVALTTDTSLLTAAGNDIGFDNIFARQVEALCRKGDLLVLHSTSGKSENLLRAAKAAKAKGVAVVALLGKDGGPLKALVDEAYVVRSEVGSEIQETHLAIEHLIVEVVEAELIGS
ncbi:MAG: SIS domain-containing protein [Gemmatimonadetes bacterium]|nr:SIS domain-containing protein [Gemmatimonadota bacterium]